jgi:hypothetical protein
VVGTGTEKGGFKPRHFHHGGGTELAPADAVVAAAAAGDLIGEEDGVSLRIDAVGIGFDHPIMVVVTDLKQVARFDGATDDFVVLQCLSAPGLGRYLRPDTATLQNDTSIRDCLNICAPNVELLVTNTAKSNKGMIWQRGSTMDWIQD